MFEGLFPITYSNAKLKDITKPFTKAASQAPTSQIKISHITAVGVLLNQSGHVSDYDETILTLALHELREAGLSLSEDLIIDPVNLATGRDFLVEETETDIVVLCNIFNPPVSSEPMLRLGLKDHNTTAEDRHLISEKLLSHESTIWLKRIQQSKAIMSFEFGREITRDLNPTKDAEQYELEHVELGIGSYPNSIIFQQKMLKKLNESIKAESKIGTALNEALTPK